MTAEHLAFIGSIKDEVIEKRELAIKFINEIEKRYEGILSRYYGFELSDKKDNEVEFSVQILGAIADKRAIIKKGGEPDTDKAATLILDDFKNGRLGRITLETAGG